MSREIQESLRRLPAVGVLVETARARHPELAHRDGRLLAFLARRLVAAARDRMRQAPADKSAVACAEALADRLADAAADFGRPGTERVVNATGVVLHSGIGRAVYAEEARAAIGDLSTYCLLEVDREAGQRRLRDAFCEELLIELTGAESACVVNNNAAATMLILAAVGAGREVVVSRSQMIEIGGSFRLPDVFEASGCKLREVGTTNRSYVRDYEAVIGEQTAALMLVHTSNYRIVGFTEHVDLPELVALGRARGLPVIHDLGSGSLVDLAPFGVHDEPPVQASVKAGADLVCFSGDKLVGGPQAGIVIGKKKWVDLVRKHPLARALRIDKAQAVGLEATLKLYLEPDKVFERVPTLRMLAEKPEATAARAQRLHAALAPLGAESDVIEVVASTCELGAGTLPTHQLASHAVRLRLEGIAADRLARALRLARTSVFGRVKDDYVLLDARTLQVGDVDRLRDSLARVIEELRR